MIERLGWKENFLNGFLLLHQTNIKVTIEKFIMWLRRLIMRNEIKMNGYGLQNNNDKLSLF